MKDSGIPWIGEIPKEWSVSLIGSCIKEVDCKNTDGKEDNALQFKMGTIISKRNGDSKYNPETLEAYNIVKVGDIIINGLNLSFDLISQRVGLVKENGVITSTYIAVRPTTNISNEFLTYLFKAYDNCKAFHSMGRGLRQTLSYGELRKYYVVLPLKKEQQRIAEFLDRKCGEIDEAITLQEEFIEELKVYKQSVITEAVTRGLNPNVKFKDSGIDWIGEIPEGWNIGKVSRYFSVRLGKMLQPNPKIDSDSYEYYMCAANVGQNTIKYEPLRQMWFSETEKKMYEVKRGDLLVVEGGDVASSDIVKDDVANLYFQNALHRVRPRRDDDIRILHYLLMTAKSLGHIELICNRATISHFTKEKFECLQIPMPPKLEQQQIADYLDDKCTEIDSLISIKLQKIDELKNHKKSIIYEYVTGKKEVDG